MLSMWLLLARDCQKDLSGGWSAAKSPRQQEDGAEGDWEREEGAARKKREGAWLGRTSSWNIIRMGRFLTLCRIFPVQVGASVSKILKFLLEETSKTLSNNSVMIGSMMVLLHCIAFVKLHLCQC